MIFRLHEEPCGKPQGIFGRATASGPLRRSKALGYEGWTAPRQGGTPLPYLGIHPCGNLLRPRGYDLPSPTEAGYAKAGGQEPQGILPDVLIKADRPIFKRIQKKLDSRLHGNDRD